MTIRDEWIARYKGKSQKQAKTVLNSFDLFIKEKYFDNEDNFLVKCKIGDEQNKYLLLDDLVQFWDRKHIAPSSIRNYFTFIRAYLRRNGIKTDDGDIKDYVKFPHAIEENRSPLTKDHIKTILAQCDPIHKAFFLFLGCTGMRVGEVIQLQVGWLDFSLYQQYKVVIVNIPAGVTKGKSERFTFCTDQAYQSMKPYIENKLAPSSLVFDFSYGSAEEYMQSVRERCGFTEKYASGFHKIHIHVFRSFVDTILTNKTSTKICKFLLGHKDRYRYYRPKPIEIVELYKKAEPEFLITIE